MTDDPHPPPRATGDDEATALTVGADDAGARLDAYLAGRLAVSRARVQRGIADRDVLVNGRDARASYRVRAGDAIEFDLPAPVTTELVPEDLPLDVRYEDDAVLVLVKPAGLVVHPAAGITRGTLANGLAFRFADRGPGGATLRPGLVHRLDRDTSGLMVVAKTDAALEHLADQFRARTVAKHYVALVYGTPTTTDGTIDAPLGRDRRNRLKMAVYPRGQGRAALTLYRVRTAFDEFALLDVEIKTGRTHQIRVHCTHLGHPVVADEVYGRGRANAVKNPAHRAAIARLGRQFLHAARLAFDHPRTGERMEFSAALPDDLQAMLDALAG
jgi:23S rRNA pseudouridine1911/1915/1917 synthase